MTRDAWSDFTELVSFRGSTRHGIENKDALLPCCGVHYLNLYCCTVCLSVSPIFNPIPILALSVGLTPPTTTVCG